MPFSGNQLHLRRTWSVGSCHIRLRSVALSSVAPNPFEDCMSGKPQEKSVLLRIVQGGQMAGPFMRMRLHEVLSSSPWKTAPLSACQHVAH
ncbi:hypothetical protein GEV33_007015 [Tenebrio molitor]|uniref:Uncharacterized protein n=1 Tax=Tenebrio molitor TaxID=7067 RepID=A0A8J6HJ11_TENMO|nr:hypothetical protein GEV33_007015 [Tenebrio molitor]